MKMNKLLAEELVTKKIKIENIFLDANNPRFSEIRESEEILIEDSRIPEESVQNECLRKLREHFDVDTLKKSIVENGFLPTDRIVVRELHGIKGKYVVAEGNRRLAAIKLIFEEYKRGLPVPPKLIKNLEEIECLVYTGKEKEIAWIIQGIRHLSGIKTWPAYSQAVFIQKLVDKYKVEKRELAKKTGMKTGEVTKRLRAIRAFQQAKEDEEYGELITPKDYSMFEEILNKSKLREWLGWNDKELKFENEENLKKLLSWTHPTEGEPQIRWDIHMRDLAKLLDYPEIFRKFENNEISFEKACDEMKEIEMKKRISKKVKDYFNDLKRTVDEIKKMPTLEILKSKMKKEFIKKLKELKQVVEDQLKLLGK